MKQIYFMILFKHKNKGIVQPTKCQTPPSLAKWMFLLYSITELPHLLKVSDVEQTSYSLDLSPITQSPNYEIGFAKCPFTERPYNCPWCAFFPTAKSNKPDLFNYKCVFWSLTEGPLWYQVLNSFKIPKIPTTLQHMNSLHTLKQTLYFFVHSSNPCPRVYRIFFCY